MSSVLDHSVLSARATHPLHDDERVWPETNCYVDLWIELLHAQGLEPLAGLAFTLDLDFEGDQYTFFKYSLDEMRLLYGVEVQELNLWRPIIEHASQQVALGRIFMPEVDSFFLPDTAGVGYRLEHGKTTIAIDRIDVAARTLGYFHNRGHHTLSGDDFAGALRLDDHTAGPEILAPYAEIAKLERVIRRPERELAALALDLARLHLARRPLSNPIARHRTRIATDLAWLRGEPLSTFHQYAFATVRQAGACYGLTAAFLRWLDAHDPHGFEPAAAAFESISSNAKALQFKLARMANLKREVDVTPLLAQMEASWNEGMARLAECIGD